MAKIKTSLGKSSDSASVARHNRRHFLNVCTALGVGGTLLPGVLWGLVQETKDATPKVTKEMIAQAMAIAGVEIKEEYREMMLEGLNDNAKSYLAIQKLNI